MESNLQYLSIPLRVCIALVRAAKKFCEYAGTSRVCLEEGLPYVREVSHEDLMWNSLSTLCNQLADDC
jgi:hypothetical protein